MLDDCDAFQKKLLKVHSFDVVVSHLLQPECEIMNLIKSVLYDVILYGKLTCTQKLTRWSA